MEDKLMEVVSQIGTLATRGRVLAYRDEALRAWTLAGGIGAVRSELLGDLRTALERVCLSSSYYRMLLGDAGVDPSTLTGLERLGAVPVTTKEEFRQHRAEFVGSVPKGLCTVEMTTGGSTGQPLRFSMSRDDYLRSVGVQLAGWHLAGYVLGERIAVFAGASIARREAVPWHVSLPDLVLNRRQFSAADLDDDRILRYWEYIERWRPAYIRGYPSAIAEFCRHRSKAHSDQYRPHAVLTTSEMLTESDRHVIEQVLGAPVFDGWGLNDGGAAAYECAEHAGMHVDTTRAYVETVDDAGRPVWGVPGRIVVTSLTNRAFPFVRYDTGDIGVLEWRECKCGRSGLMLTQLLGRSNDTLRLGRARISPSSTTVLFGRLEHLKRYHVVQDAPLHVTVTLDTEEGFDRKASEEAVAGSIKSRCPEAGITFVYEPLPLPADGSKWQSVEVLDCARSGSDETGT
jgi:phenylacetate-CoA ligase